GVADDVLFVQVRQVRRGLGIRPRAGTRRSVQGGHEGGQRFVAVLAELRRILDLLEGYDVGVEPVDRRDDLAFLPGEVLRVPRTACIAAAADTDRIAVAVGVRLAPVEVHTQRGEVVQHVERGQGDFAADVFRRAVGLARVARVEGDDV